MASAGTSGIKASNDAVAAVVVENCGVSGLDGLNTNIFRHIDPELKAKINMFYVLGTVRQTVVLFTTVNDTFCMFDACAVTSVAGGDVATGTEQPFIVPELSNKGVVSVTSGMCTIYERAEYDDVRPEVKVLALTSNGQVYEWNFYIRQVSENSFEKRPLLIGGILSGKQVIQALCSAGHSVALLKNGSMYAWGYNGLGQLETGNFDGSFTNPVVKVVTATLEKSDDTVKSIVCSYASTYALTKKGLVFAWGFNRLTSGVSSATTQECSKEPTLLQELAKLVVVKITSGFDHCLALTDEGDMYQWGSDMMGVDNTKLFIRPTLCQFEIGAITDIATQRYTFAAMNKRGVVYVWGRCIGLNAASPIPTQFTSVQEAVLCFSGETSASQIVARPLRPPISFVKSFEKAFNDAESSDLKVLVGGKTVHVHKLILQIRSEHFATMFQSQWKESAEHVIEIEEYSHSVYSAYLKYLYTNEVDVVAEELSDLFDLANSYFENELKQRCSDLIKHKLSVQKVAAIYEKAVINKQPDLEECCIQLAASHSAAVIQSNAFAAMADSLAKLFVREISKNQAL